MKASLIQMLCVGIGMLFILGGESSFGAAFIAASLVIMALDKDKQ